MSLIRPITIAALSLTVAACSSDHRSPGTADAAAGGQPGSHTDAGQSTGGAPSAEAGDGAWTFPGSPGLPSSTPWGPNLLGLQDHNDPSNGASDVAFGFFWDPAVVYVPFVGGGCIAFGTAPGHAGGRDVGVVTVTAGADGGIVSLTRDPSLGDYFLDGPSDPWRVGDQLSFTSGVIHGGPLTVPTPFTSENLSAQTSFSRGADAQITFSGSNATKVSFSSSAFNNGTKQFFFLVCEADAASGHLTIPAAALSAFPASVTSVDAKLSPVNQAQTGDLAFFVAGESAKATLVLSAD